MSDGRKPLHPEVLLAVMEATHDPDDLLAESFECPRCHETHTDMVFRRFSRPVGRKGIVTHTHWSWCSKLEEPILVIEQRDGLPCAPDVSGHGAVYRLGDLIDAHKAVLAVSKAEAAQ